jgi:hypothetical protein
MVRYAQNTGKTRCSTLRKIVRKVRRRRRGIVNKTETRVSVRRTPAQRVFGLPGLTACTFPPIAQPVSCRCSPGFRCQAVRLSPRRYGRTETTVSVLSMLLFRRCAYHPGDTGQSTPRPGWREGQRPIATACNPPPRPSVSDCDRETWGFSRKGSGSALLSGGGVVWRLSALGQCQGERRAAELVAAWSAAELVPVPLRRPADVLRVPGHPSYGRGQLVVASCWGCLAGMTWQHLGGTWATGCQRRSWDSGDIDEARCRVDCF